MAEKRVSIFELENELDIQKEFNRLRGILFSDSIAKADIGYDHGPFISVINKRIFPYWPHRDTFLDVFEYLDFIGLDYRVRNGSLNIDETSFLNFLEFFANITDYMLLFCKKNNIIWSLDPVISGCILNIPKILSKMHYKKKKINEKTLIIKEDIDIDSVADSVPKDILVILLKYCDFRIENNLEVKKSLLKSIDLYIDNNKKSFQRLENGKSLVSDIDFIFNKFGINHEIDESFSNYTKSELLNLYDKVFVLCLELFRKEKVQIIQKDIAILKKGAKTVSD